VAAIGKIVESDRLQPRAFINDTLPHGEGFRKTGKHNYISGISFATVLRARAIASTSN
jgi:hypothetical protein